MKVDVAAAVDVDGAEHRRNVFIAQAVRVRVADNARKHVLDLPQVDGAASCGMVRQNRKLGENAKVALESQMAVRAAASNAQRYVVTRKCLR